MLPLTKVSADILDGREKRMKRKARVDNRLSAGLAINLFI
jgi:hypothetical protein